ncbi:MAG: hypothetical protein Q9221_001403 [Calogaya cf. arnoldii]
METLGRIETCFDTTFGPVPRVPPLRRDGAHTRFERGGVRPGRGSNDLRPLSLNTGQTDILDILNEGPPPRSNTGQTDILDILNEGPPPRSNTPPTLSTTRKAKQSTSKKEGVVVKNPLGSIRKLFSPKQRSKDYAHDLQQAFRATAYKLDTGDQEATKTSSGSECSLSPLTADHLQRQLAVHNGIPDYGEVYVVPPHQCFGDGGSRSFLQNECSTSGRQGHSNGEPLITPLKASRTAGSEDTSPLRSRREYVSPVIANSSPASPKIYGQPPPQMMSPVVPRKVTKEHLDLSSYPSLPREALAQLPKELEPTMPISNDCGSPIHHSQPISPQFAHHYHSGSVQGNASNVKMASRSASASQLRVNFEDAWPQSSCVPLRHEQSMDSVVDGLKNSEELLESLLQNVRYKKNGKVKKYKDNDPRMVNLGYLAIEEIYGRQAAVKRFAGPRVVNAATWENQRADMEEEEKKIGLGISSRFSAQSIEARETRHHRGDSNESKGSIVHSPVTSRSGYVTPLTPKERQEFYENLNRLVNDDGDRSKKAHGDFGITCTHVHGNDASAPQSPFDDPQLSDQSTTTPSTLGAPGGQSSYQRRKHSSPITSNPRTEVSSAFKKIQGLYMSTKETRAEVLARLREITATQRVYSDETKHSSHGRRSIHRNLRCTEHMGHCGVCNATCCVYYEAIEAARDAVTPYDQGFANEVGRSISEASIYADDLPTFLRCTDCSRMGSKRHVTHDLWLGRTSCALTTQSILTTQTESVNHIANMRTFEDTFSGEKIYPGKGKLYVRGDSKIFRFQNGKTESLFLQRKNPRRIAWTTLYRRQHKKGISEEIAKKRTRRTVKQQRGIVGASLDVIKERRSQRPEARAAARQEAIKAGKEKKATAESKKKQEKAKSAAGAARGQAGRMVSKQGAKGAPSKASGKVR